MTSSAKNIDIIKTKKHPNTFYLLLFWQFWWALSFYGLWALLPVHLNQNLNLSEELSFAIFGGYAALSAALLFLGGTIADKYLGAKRMLKFGTFFQSLGYFSVAYSAAAQNTLFLFLGLGFVVIGRSVANTTPPTILASAYEENSPKLDSAFTYLYMVNNIGAFFGQLAIPIIAYQFSWQLAFALSGIGMAINLVGVILMRKVMEKHGSFLDKSPIKTNRYLIFSIGALGAIVVSSYLLTNLALANIVMFGAAAIILASIINFMKHESKNSRIKMSVGIVLFIQAYIFFNLYNQMPTSLNFFAINNIEPYIFGIYINPVSFQSLNPFWIILFSPILAEIYNRLGAKGKDLSIPAKYATGMMVCGFAFALAGISKFFANEYGMLSSFWIAAPHFLFAIGELLISALGLSVVAKLFPVKIRGFCYGAWYMTVALASVSGAKIASFSTSPDEHTTALESLTIYSNYFLVLAGVTIAIAVVITLFSPILSKLLETKN